MMVGFVQALELFLLGALNGKQRVSKPSGGIESAPAGFHIGRALPFGDLAPTAGKTVVLPPRAQEKHVLLLGGSGCGKSTLLHRLRDADIAEGRTIVDIDYRGDSFDRSLTRCIHAGVPQERLTLIDLRSRDVSIPLNLLGFGPGDSYSRAAAVYAALVDESPSWGVQLGSDLRFALSALAEARMSLLEVDLLLAPQGESFRSTISAKVTDDYTRDFLAEYGTLKPDAQQARLAAVANKLTPLLHHPDLRASLGLPGAPDFQKILDEPGHITLVALGVDRQPNARLIGRTLVLALQRHILARVDVPEKSRNPVTLYIDEFSNLAGEEFCQLVAEGRRFRAALTLAHQHGAQTNVSLRHALRTNISTQFYFQTGAIEAADLSPEIVSSLPREEVRRTLLTLPVGCAILNRRGEPAGLVEMPDAPDPSVDPTLLAEYKADGLAGAGIERQKAERMLQAVRESTRHDWKQSQTAIQEEVVHERKPWKKPHSA